MRYVPSKTRQAMKDSFFAGVVVCGLEGSQAEPPSGCGSKNRYQNGTLVSRHMDLLLPFAPPV